MKKRAEKGRMYRFFFMVVLTAALLYGCGSSQKLSEKFDAEEVKKAAEEVIGLVNEGDFDTLAEEKWNTIMQTSLDADTMAAQVEPVVEELGEFQSFDKEAVVGETDKETEQEFAVAVIRVQYEKRKAQYTISFDEDMKVGGFYIK